MEHSSSIEAGSVVTAEYIVVTVIAAEDLKADLQVLARFGDMPTHRGIFHAIRKSKPHSAPGPDAIGPGIYRHRAAIDWSVSQFFTLSVKQSVCLRAPIQNREGFLFACWKRAAVTIECSNHRSILCANTDGKNIAKMERAQIADDIWDFLSHDNMFQCGGMKMRGTDIANLLVRSLVGTRKISGFCCAGSYVDIVSAFYCICMEYLVHCASSYEALAQLLMTLGLDRDAIHQLAELLADPPALAAAQVPELLQYSISHYF